MVQKRVGGQRPAADIVRGSEEKRYLAPALETTSEEKKGIRNVMRGTEGSKGQAFLKRVRFLGSRGEKRRNPKDNVLLKLKKGTKAGRGLKRR